MKINFVIEYYVPIISTKMMFIYYSDLYACFFSTIFPYFFEILDVIRGVENISTMFALNFSINSDELFDYEDEYENKEYEEDEEIQQILDTIMIISKRYSKELKDYFRKKGVKSFDDITSELFDDLKKEFRKLAEENQKRAPKEIKVKCPECEKILKPNNRDEPITITTFHFPLTVIRNVFYCRDCKVRIDPLFNNHVFDLYGGYKLTNKVAETITFKAQKNSSFKEAKEDLEKDLNIKVGETTIIEITEKVGGEIYSEKYKQAELFYEKCEVPAVKEKDKEDCILYILADGSMVNILNSEVKGASWKEMKLGLVYKDNNQIKMPNGKNKITSKEYISHLGSVNEFKKLLYETAIKNGYGKTTQVVFLGDGAPWLWNLCQELFPDAIQILDYYHLKENVYGYAKNKIPNDKAKSDAWAEEIINDVYNGKIEEALDIIPKKKIKQNGGVDTTDNLYNYITNNKDRINYKKFKGLGFNIGSGAIESGHKKVIQQRVKQPGMHWTHQGCQSLAALRAKYCSDAWEEVEEHIYCAA